MWTYWVIDPYWFVVFWVLYSLFLTIAIRGVLFPLVARAWYNRRASTHQKGEDVFGGEQ